MAKFKNGSGKPIFGLEPLKPATDNQRLALDMFETKIITVLEGLAGTGKTYIALHYALQQFISGNTRKIILTRPLINVEDEKIGFLPGEVLDKTRPYTEQFNEYMNEFMPQLNFADEKRMEQGVEFIPLAFIRGRNFADSIIIADEMQNSTPLQMKTLLTRIAEGSKVIILGDVTQADRPKAVTNGLRDLTAKLNHKPIDEIGVVTFGPEDIQRSAIIKQIMQLYGDI